MLEYKERDNLQVTLIKVEIIKDEDEDGINLEDCSIDLKCGTYQLITKAHWT